MTELQSWDKFTGKARHRLTVEVRDRQVSLDRDLFMDLMKQAGWFLETHIIEHQKEAP